ncbi:MAG: DUF2807 domain-containing protein [Pedobacter sp.]|nr:DUF2807 domain-containing protein [Pedobacter sp.]MDQ8052523.1 DUF2807 domain-containing protein [Pedobacter sp.]
MKIAIKTFIAILTTTIILGTTAATTFAEDGKKETMLSEVKKVNKINVSGNVELILVQSSDERVKIYDEYYAKNALVQQEAGELRISSYNKETLTVVVYVSNLTEISASANASIRTAGKFNALSLVVNLKDQASANLNTNTVDLSSNVAGLAKLTLAGYSESYNGLVAGNANVNMEQFAAASKSIQSKNSAIAASFALNKAQVLGAE